MHGPVRGRISVPLGITCMTSVQCAAWSLRLGFGGTWTYMFILILPCEPFRGERSKRKEKLWA